MIKPDWFDEWFNGLFRGHIFTPKEVAGILRSGKTRIYSALEMGELEAIRIGRGWCIPRKCLKTWLLSGWNLQ